MVTTAKGTFYAPSPPPQSGGETALRNWADKEYGRISTAIKNGRAQFLSMDVLQEAPAKPFAGMVAYFAATIVGATEGLYEYRSTGAWFKLRHTGQTWRRGCNRFGSFMSGRRRGYQQWEFEKLVRAAISFAWRYAVAAWQAQFGFSFENARRPHAVLFLLQRLARLDYSRWCLL
jgi:hypothetical protein